MTDAPSRLDSPRIPPLPADERNDEAAELLAAFRQPDGSELNIFATLARHPKLLKRWASFGAALLYGGRLPERDRELLILRTGYLCGSRYEWGQHVRIALDAGIPQADIDRVAEGPDADGWTEHDAVLLRAADELHSDHQIGDDTWAALSDRYDDQQLIEVCMVVGQYHLVAFTLNSLGVPAEPGLPEMPS